MVVSHTHNESVGCWCLNRHQHFCKSDSGLALLTTKYSCLFAASWSHNFLAVQPHLPDNHLHSQHLLHLHPPPPISHSGEKQPVHINTSWMVFRPHRIPPPTPGRINMGYNCPELSAPWLQLTSRTRALPALLPGDNAIGRLRGTPLEGGIPGGHGADLRGGLLRRWSWLSGDLGHGSFAATVETRAGLHANGVCGKRF